jgi:ferredoxin
MKVVVLSDRCQGHTLCNMTAPELFVLSDEDGHASASCDVVPEHLEALARRAALGCPEQAIVLED